MNAQLVIKLEKQVTEILNPIFSKVRNHAYELLRIKRNELSAEALKGAAVKDLVEQLKLARDTYSEVHKKCEEASEVLCKAHAKAVEDLMEKHRDELEALGESNAAARAKASERYLKLNDKLESLGFKLASANCNSDITNGDVQTNSVGDAVIPLWSVIGLRKPASPRDNVYMVNGLAWLGLTSKKDKEITTRARGLIAKRVAEIDATSEALTEAVSVMWSIQSREELHEALEDVNMKKRFLKSYLSDEDYLHLVCADLPEI